MGLAAQMRGNLGSAQTGRGPSRGIWGDCPLDSILAGSIHGIVLMDDFENQPFWVAGTGTTLKYRYYGDTGVTISPTYVRGMTTSTGAGIVEIAGNDADNDEGSIQQYGAPFVISDAAADERKLWYEARVALTSVTNNHTAFFIGLGEENFAAADALVDDTAEPADKDYIGFHTVCADGNGLLFSYNKSGDSGTRTAVVLDTADAVLVAATYIKLGFIYDPAAAASKRIELFVNGIPQANKVTSTAIATATAGSLFPDGEELAAMWLTKNGDAGSAAHAAQMDWWRAVQLG